MTLGEKFVEIRNRLGLSQKQFGDILNISVQKLKKIEDGNVNADAKIVERFTSVFNISDNGQKKSVSKADFITMTLKIDFEKYKNLFEAYVGELKKYYGEPWQVYVLAKFKCKKKIERCFDLFFNNNKSSVINEMKTFTPSYLVKKGDIKLLVNITGDMFIVSEVKGINDDDRFVFDGYRYVKANKIELK